MISVVISDVIKYKATIMNRIINIPNVLELINDEAVTEPIQLRDNNVFRYLKIPNTTTKVKNYICFDFNSRKSRVNKVYKDVVINVFIICHESDINTPWGARHDVLSGLIINDFNWSDFLGFELELDSDSEDILQTEYHIRKLQFKNRTTDSFSNKVHYND